MSVGNIRNINDLENKKRQYAEMLQLMIENESIKEKRVADYKNPNKPPPVPPQYKTVADQLKDTQLQEKIAIDNIKELGVDFSEARSFVLQLQQRKDGVDNIIKLNTNFPAFKKIITEGLLIKSLTADTLLNKWEEFSANIDVITGLKSASTKSTSAFSSSTIAVEKIPIEDTMATFSIFLDEVIQKNSESKLDILQQLLSSTKDNLISSISYLLSESQLSKISNLTPLEKNQINTVAERLLSVNKIPTAKEFILLMSQIENSFDSLSDANLVSTSDSISAGLVKLNRLLGQILDNDNKKRLEEFGALVDKLIGNLYQETEKSIPKADPIIYDTSSKIEMVRFIMAKQLYYELFRIPKEEEVDEDELTQIADEVNKLTKTKLQKFLRNYKADLQRDEFLLRDYVNKTTSPEDALDDYEKEQERIQLIIKGLGETFDMMGYELGDYQNLYKEIVRLKLIPNDKSAVGTNFSNKNNLRDYIFSLIEGNPTLKDFIDRRYFEEEENFRRKNLVREQLKEKFAPPPLKPLRPPPSPPPLKPLRPPPPPPEVSNFQLTREYIADKLLSFTKRDYYDRFIALRDEFPSYKLKVIRQTGRFRGLIKPYEEFDSEYKNEDLMDIVFNNEFDYRDIRYRIRNENFNPTLPEFQRLPKQGLGMKKGCGKVQVYIPERNLVKPKPTLKAGCGSKPYEHRRIKIGKGVGVAEELPKYIEFGKFIIHRPQLEKNTLNFKYPSEGRVPTLPIVNIGDDFKDFLLGVLETGKLSDNQFNKLSQNEKDFFIKAVKGAGLENSLFKGKGKLYPDDEKKDRDRFNILKGEFDAGNNNQNLIKELRQLVIKFVDKRIIPKKQGLEFLQQLE